MFNHIKVSAPGRICLFGEHQDYLSLPVIACAISKRIFIEGVKRADKKIKIELPDISSEEEFTLSENISYTKERDYFKSAVNILIREGFTFSNGADCVIKGYVPINAGTSSSSALIISWIVFLIHISNQPKKVEPRLIAELAHKAEVLEFSEPGGMMDHFAISFGGLISLRFKPKLKETILKTKLKSFVLSNSAEPKDTKEILSRVKLGVINAADKLSKNYPEFSLHNIMIDDLKKYKSDLSNDEYNLLYGTLRNRDITNEAEHLLKSDITNHERIGYLLNEHQNILRDRLKISTKKINQMIEAALNAGALGAKINGSGGGGCMFAYADKNIFDVYEAVKKIAPQTYIVNVDNGVQSEII